MQEVSFPLQIPVDKHFLIVEPAILKPSSQRNAISLGYVVRSNPIAEPFVGIASEPQSLATARYKKDQCSYRLAYSILLTTCINHLLYM